jgi:aminoglycoside phosphotransferase (APT) family kinase protein
MIFNDFHFHRSKQIVVMDVPQCLSGEGDSVHSEEPKLAINLDELKRCASFRFCRRCTEIRKLASGGSNDVFVLYFAAEEVQHEQWSCLARVSHHIAPVEKLLSEVATMCQIKAHTSVPVPEVYFYDFDASNTVGAQYMFIERLPGRQLSSVWDQLSLDDKKSVVAALANALVQLSSLKFDQIGCLTKGGKVGPLLCQHSEFFEYRTTGPFASTLEYLLSYIPTDPEASEVFSSVRKVIESYMSTTKNSSISGPFRIIHADLSISNILLTYDGSGNSSPALSGVIDWECAHTGPAYYFYEYPGFIFDDDDPLGAVDHEALRQHFADTLYKAFPEGSPEHQEVVQSLDKNFTLNGYFFEVIYGTLWERRLFELKARNYVDSVEDGTGVPYDNGLGNYSDDEESSSDEFSSDEESDDDSEDELSSDE